MIHDLGRHGENIVAHWFRWQGYRIRGQNILTPYGELDLWVQKSQRSYFVEIKTRRTPPENLSVSGLTHTKLQRLRRIFAYLRHTLVCPGQAYLSYILLIPKGIFWIPHLLAAEPRLICFSKDGDKPWPKIIK